MKTTILNVSVVALLTLVGQSQGQQPNQPSSQDTTPKAPEPVQPAAPAAPQPAPQPAAEPAAPAAPTPAATSSSVSGTFANVDEVTRWIETYYQKPEPHRVLDAFRTLIRENAFASGNKDFNWNMVGFFWACMHQNEAFMAEWCATIGDLVEPSKTWWWTCVWQSQTEAGNQAIIEAVKLPDGHKDKINFPWLQQKPQDITQANFRGDGGQQINMLWHAFYATGSDTMIFKLYEAFVPAEPKPPQNPVEEELAKKKRLRNAQMIENVTKSFAENLPKHPKALEICRDSLEKLKDPVKSHIAKLVADADAAIAAKNAPAEPKIDAPAPSEKPADKPEAKPEPTPEPKSDPNAEPKTEPKPEPTPGPR